MVFDLDQFAVGNGCGEPENFGVIDPRMAGHDAVSLARF
jgi:hypothetical protein